VLRIVNYAAPHLCKEPVKLVLAGSHREPSPQEAPIPGESPIPGGPPIPADPPGVPPSPVAQPESTQFYRVGPKAS
jgi:hypothetical protein